MPLTQLEWINLFTAAESDDEMIPPYRLNGPPASAPLRTAGVKVDET